MSPNIPGRGRTRPYLLGPDLGKWWGRGLCDKTHQWRERVHREGDSENQEAKSDVRGETETERETWNTHTSRDTQSLTQGPAHTCPPPTLSVASRLPPGPLGVPIPTRRLPCFAVCLPSTSTHPARLQGALHWVSRISALRLQGGRISFRAHLGALRSWSRCSSWFLQLGPHLSLPPLCPVTLTATN